MRVLLPYMISYNKILKTSDQANEKGNADKMEVIVFYNLIL